MISDKKKWYQNYSVKVAAIVVAIGATGTLIGYIIKAVNWWGDHKASYNNIELLLTQDSIKTLQINDLVKYVDRKKKGGYAVGHRVKWTTDEITEKRRKVKQFRDWSGQAHNITLDRTLSEYYGREYYYYTDDNDSIIYCP